MLGNSEKASGAREAGREGETSDMNSWSWAEARARGMAGAGERDVSLRQGGHP